MAAEKSLIEEAMKLPDEDEDVQEQLPIKRMHKKRTPNKRKTPHKRGGHRSPHGKGKHHHGHRKHHGKPKRTPSGKSKINRTPGNHTPDKASPPPPPPVKEIPLERIDEKFSFSDFPEILLYTLPKPPKKQSRGKLAMKKRAPSPVSPNEKLPGIPKTKKTKPEMELAKFCENKFINKHCRTVKKQQPPATKESPPIVKNSPKSNSVLMALLLKDICKQKKFNKEKPVEQPKPPPPPKVVPPPPAPKPTMNESELMNFLAGIYTGWPPQLPKTEVKRDLEYSFKLPKRFREDCAISSKIEQLPNEWNEIIKRHGYQVDRIIGQGSGKFLSVGWRLIQGQSSQRVSVKFFVIRDDSVVRELEICSRLKHRFIMEMYDVLHLDPFTAMIYEYSEFDAAEYIRVPERRPSSQLAKTFMAQMADAMVFLHFNGVAHQDLTLQNTYICNNIPGLSSVAKLWGFSYVELSPPLRMFLLMKRLKYSTEKIIEKVNCVLNESFKLNFGGSNKSLAYRAPEIICNTDQYYKPFPADVFSLGICYFLLMFNEFPFRQVWNPNQNFRPCKDDIDRYRQAVVSAEWIVPHEQIVQQDINLEALLTVMLWADPIHRIPSDQILFHPYFQFDENIKKIFADIPNFGTNNEEPIWNCDPTKKGKIGIIYI